MAGGRTTPGVVRVGDTVRRPAGPHSAFVHAFLAALEQAGFAGAPRTLGVDAEGRDVLAFIPGDVPAELGAFPDAATSAAARLLRVLHDVTVRTSLRGAAEVVCHGDPGPCNAVFRGGLPVAFIDFDAAHPGARRDDVGYAAWLWLDLGNADLDPGLQGRRLAAFVQAYGALPSADAVPAVLDAQEMLAGRAGAPTHVRAWAASCRAWTVQHRATLEQGTDTHVHPGT